MNGPRVVRWLALALLGASTVGLVRVSASPEAPQGKEEKQKPAAVEAAPPQDVKLQLGALQVAIDSETGELRPLTRQEAAHLANEMRKRFKPREIGEPTLRPDGSLSAIVVPNVFRFSVARIDGDGEVRLDCAESTEDAIEHLTHTAENPVPQKRDVK
jgi:hypothetical protein